MRKSLRATVTLFAAALFLPVSALTASAAPVGNDTLRGALPTTLGETYTQDTTIAKTERLDAALNEFCGAPAVLGSVWYKYTSDGSEGVGFLVDGTGTNYDLGLMIFEGAPAAETLVSCGPMKAAAYFNPDNPNTTYYIMAFTANAIDPVGGDLVLTVTVPETPTVSVTVDPRGTAYKDGSARITGTYSCTGAEYSELGGMLTQRVGRLKVVGEFYVTDLICDGGTYDWEAYAVAANGTFSGGKAANVTLGFVCGALECADGYADYTIQLSRAG